jgi:hypothetical protein
MNTNQHECPEAANRERPATDRQGITHKVTLGESPDDRTDFYITLNRYPDGRPCEVFAKATGGYQGWCDCLARLMSLLLQHGVPVAVMCGQLERAHFPPFNMVPGARHARSFPDYLARWMEGQTTDCRPQTTDQKSEPQIQPSHEATADKLNADEHGCGD